MKRLDETLKMLKDAAAEHDSIAVSYSAGKDSVAVMDLCVRSFRRVVGFHMYLVPGLECIDRDLAEAEQRWKVQILQYPHPNLRESIKFGYFCNPRWTRDDLPPWKLKDVYSLVSLETGCRLIANGAKRADSLQRRAYVGTLKGVLHPIAGWSQADVYAYMGLRRLPKSRTQMFSVMNGVDLSPPTLIWLHDNWPKDFEKIEEVFPFVRAVIKRRDWRGVPSPEAYGGKVA